MYNTTPAAAITEDLSLSQDVARAYLGAPWRMPTVAEFQELVDNCTNVWTSINGVNGRLFTSNVNGKTLFFPAAGYFNGTFLSGHGGYGDYWSTSYISDSNARGLGFNSQAVYPRDSSPRYEGFSVRAVREA